jgi:hypothetical protein
MHPTLQISAVASHSAPRMTSGQRYCRVWMFSVKCFQQYDAFPRSPILTWIVSFSDFGLGLDLDCVSGVSDLGAVWDNRDGPRCGGLGDFGTGSHALVNPTISSEKPVACASPANGGRSPIEASDEAVTVAPFPSGWQIMVTGDTLLAAGAHLGALTEPNVCPFPVLIKDVGAVLSVSARVDEDEAEDEAEGGLAVVEIASVDIFRTSALGCPGRVRGSETAVGRG